MKRIVVDSSASLYQMDGIDFAAVPLKIVTDEREYLDDGTLDAVEMATTLRTYKGKTSTSCPNIGDWLEAYEGADEIYAITITGTLSGSCNAAQLAAEEYQAEHPGAQVFVLDSLSAGPELVLLAEHIRALIQEGREFDDVCEEMLRYRHHTHLLFSLESLANLARNGRVKPAVAAVARMLNIRVIGKASDVGELDVLCKTRGEHGALERIVLELKDKFGKGTAEFSAGSLSASVPAVMGKGNRGEAVAALAALGYSQAEAASALSDCADTMSVEDMIRAGLKKLSRNL